MSLDDLRAKADGLAKTAVNLNQNLFSLYENMEAFSLGVIELRDALNLYKPEPPAPPTPTTFTPVRYARFNYVVDNTHSIDTQVSRWPVQVLQGDEWHLPQLNALKAREGVLTLRYADPVVRRSGDPNGWTQCSPPHMIRDAWMLRDSRGAIISRTRDGDQFVDPGDLEYRATAAKFLVDVCVREGWDGVWLDEINANPSWSFGPWPSKYPNAYQYSLAVRGFVYAIVEALDTVGKKCFVNMAASSTLGDAWSLSLAGQPSIDGHCLEFYVARGDNPVATLENGEWKKLLDWTVARERAGQFGMYHAMTTDPNLALYALGTFLLATEGHGVFMASQDPYGLADVWVPEFEAARKLGRPKAGYYIAGGTYVRDFENGQVLVSPQAAHTVASIILN